LKPTGLITLTTDFGMQDGNVGVMKGVIYGINPHIKIVDLSHDIEPQNIVQAAFVLSRHCRYFPAGTIHLVVVDPGVGSERRALIVQTAEAFFVAPDNGVLTYVVRDARRAIKHIIDISNPRFWLHNISHVFHGRDIFAPVAAHLSLGVPVSAFGEEVNDLVTFPLPQVEMGKGKLKGQVVHIDRFGNLLTNIYRRDLLSWREIRVRVGKREIVGLSRTYADGQEGEVIAYIDSSEELAVAVVNGSARDLLSAQVGDEVEVVGQ
jgi:S-adenosylmethionine hydrolase